MLFQRWTSCSSITSPTSAGLSMRPSAMRPSIPQEKAKLPVGKALSPNWSAASRPAVSVAIDFLDAAFGDEGSDARAVVGERAVEEDDETAGLEADPPMQVSGAPAKGERRLSTGRPQAPNLRRADAHDHRSRMVEE